MSIKYRSLKRMTLLLGSLGLVLSASALPPRAGAMQPPVVTRQPAEGSYQPSEANLRAREAFSQHRLGIFLHWGIYSVYGQGEWYLEEGRLHQADYAKAASAFYPWRFDAKAWARAFRDAGAGYVTFTTRHHDGFSMWHTAQSPYNIAEATPYGRDVLRELADAVRGEGMDMHLYYSILDWMRPDYPIGETGRHTQRAPKPDYESYLSFMKAQIRELLTQYGDVRAMWFDGYWDHEKDSLPFDWRLPELYRHIHSINDACLIGNNHHLAPMEGEDFQMFERDQPGENTAGYSPKTQIGRLPLEMCQTMSHKWGYNVADTTFKSVPDLVRMLVRAASRSCNLLLNIGPQPDGQLPARALDRLKGLGEWMRVYGATVNGTVGGPLGEQAWGVSTRRADTLYLHVLKADAATLTVPMARRPRRVVSYVGRKPLRWSYDKRSHQAVIILGDHSGQPDEVVEVSL